MAQILEAVMLIAFSTGWFGSIHKMLRTRQASGKSLIYVLFIGFGYVCGMFAKLLNWIDTGDLPPIIFLYGFNTLVIVFDAWLVVHFSRLEQRRRDSPTAFSFHKINGSTPATRHVEAASVAATIAPRGV